MRFKFKHKLGFAFSMMRVQFPLRLCYAMTVNKSQSQSFLQALFDTTVETFSHGQSYVALSRIRYYNTIRLIVQENNTITKDGKTIPTLLNCVYPSVILHGDENNSNNRNNSLFENLRQSAYMNGMEFTDDSSNEDNIDHVENNSDDNNDDENEHSINCNESSPDEDTKIDTDYDEDFDDDVEHDSDDEVIWTPSFTATASTNN